MQQVLTAIVEKMNADILNAIIVVAVVFAGLILYMFLTGNLKVFRDKNGKLLFKTAHQRTEYDISRLETKLPAIIEKQVTDVLSSPTLAKQEPFLSLLNDNKVLSQAVLNNQEAIKASSITLEKLAFYNSDFPVAERIAGGLRYIKLGGNSSTKHDLEAFCREHKEAYEALLLINKEWGGLINING